MKQIFISALLVLSMSSFVAGQTPEERARQEMNDGASAYKAGNFLEAQRHFERALELDPNSKNASLFIARAIQQQYRPNDNTPENIAKGEEAIEAYKRILTADENNDDAANAVTFLYRQMKNEEKEREWLLTRANLESAPQSKRADIFVMLAGKELNCSSEIIDRRENRAVVRAAGKVSFKYLKPKREEDFVRARGCAVKGLEFADAAINLNPGNPQAWAHKTNLLRQMVKMAQMEENAADQSVFERQAREAEAAYHRVSEEAARASADKPKAQQQAEQPPQQPSPPLEPTPTAATQSGEPSQDSDDTGELIPTHLPDMKDVVSGGVLDGRIINKPEPIYPPVARAARASGIVTVQVVIDEEGKVIAARPVSGHPLLQTAALVAARQASFTPVQLNGNPVKVSGVVTYEFILQ